MISSNALERDRVMLRTWLNYVNSCPRSVLNHLERYHVCLECGLRMKQGKDGGWVCECSPNAVLMEVKKTEKVR